MKKYIKPTMESERFTTNEYVAACWIVECNAPRAGSGGAKLYSETNGTSGLQTTGSNPDTLVDSFSRGVGGCNKKHIGVISSETEALPFNGYWVTSGNTYNVYWWDEDLGAAYDIHVSTSPDQAETNPNAS